MASPMLAHALQFHNEGLCVIPVRPRDKAPAVEVLGGTWEQYHTRCSTEEEIHHWWANGYNQDFNIGISHGEVSNGYVTIDIDHDSGIMDDLFEKFYGLCTGRIEQSGSGEGFHIPLRVKTLPDFGFDSTQKRPRGNKTWKTGKGAINLRCQFCQTVAVPSVHPSGGLYHYLQNGPITQVDNLDSLIEWLNLLAPPPIKTLPKAKQSIAETNNSSLVEAIRSAWPTPLSVFDHFGMVNGVQQERNGELRLLGNGGLLLTEDCSTWYSFSDEVGGGLFESWGYCRYSSAYDKHAHFQTVLIEMAEQGSLSYEVNKWGWVGLLGETADATPFRIPDSQTLVLVNGKAQADVLKLAGLSSVGLPGTFKKQWAKLFKAVGCIYVALGPGKEQQSRAIANELTANGIKARACYLPVDAGEMIGRYGATTIELMKFLEQGERL